MALAVSGVRCEIREVLLRDKPEEMLAISKKGTVPVLQLPDGQVMDESLDVMRWALNKSDPELWLNTENDLSEELIEQNDTDFKDKLDHYKYSSRYPEHPQEFYRGQAELFLSKVEVHLKKHNGLGLVSNKLTFADIAIFPFIRQFSRVEYDWFCKSPYQRIKHWQKNIEESELFKRVMKKYERWKNTNSKEYFPGL